VFLSLFSNKNISMILLRRTSQLQHQSFDITVRWSVSSKFQVPAGRIYMWRSAAFFWLIVQSAT